MNPPKTGWIPLHQQLTELKNEIERDPNLKNALTAWESTTAAQKWVHPNNSTDPWTNYYTTITTISNRITGPKHWGGEQAYQNLWDKHGQDYQQAADQLHHIIVCYRTTQKP